MRASSRVRRTERLPALRRVCGLVHGDEVVQSNLVARGYVCDGDAAEFGREAAMIRIHGLDIRVSRNGPEGPGGCVGAIVDWRFLPRG